MDLREQIMQEVGGQDCPDFIADATLKLFERWIRAEFRVAKELGSDDSARTLLTVAMKLAAMKEAKRD